MIEYITVVGKGDDKKRNFKYFPFFIKDSLWQPVTSSVLKFHQFKTFSYLKENYTKMSKQSYKKLCKWMNINNDKKMNWNKNNKHKKRITSKNNWIIWYWKMRRKRSKLRVIKISKQVQIRKLPSSRTVLKSPRKNRLQKTLTDRLLKKLLLKIKIKLFNKNPNLNNHSNKSI